MPMYGNIPSQLASHTATLMHIRGQNPKLMVYGGTGTPYGVITSHFIFLLGKIVKITILGTVYNTNLC
jgi:hypothetical protein